MGKRVVRAWIRRRGDEELMFDVGKTMSDGPRFWAYYLPTSRLLGVKINKKGMLYKAIRVDIELERIPADKEIDDSPQTIRVRRTWTADTVSIYTRSPAYTDAVSSGLCYKDWLLYTHMRINPGREIYIRVKTKARMERRVRRFE